MNNTPTLEDIVSLCKRRGFIYPGSEIYGGLAGTYDYGPMGVLLKEKVKNLWWKMFVTDREDMYGIDAAILMNPKAWEASGHVSGFNDPMVECRNCKGRFRADHLIANASGMGVADILISTNLPECPNCNKRQWDTPKQFNMMFKTKAGATDDESATVYLRPETAGGMFVNFKNVMDSFHPKLPFGLAQIGKAFRNEIAPRDFIFRSREFEQMEVEYFVPPTQWETSFEEWHGIMHLFAKEVGIQKQHLHDIEVAENDRAHYSKRTIDFEFDFPFGQKELWGLAYRTDFDLSAHTSTSKVDLSYFDEETKERVIPHVIEPSLGVDRTILAILTSAYTTDELSGEPRTYLKLPSIIAPYRAAVFPLLKNKPELVKKAREVFSALKKEGVVVAFDDNGNIGKRYRRQDEIGTPACITIDFETLENDTVTLRDRDTGNQERVAVADILSHLR